MKKYILVVIFFFFFQCITLFPESLSTVKSNAKSDLETSIKKLAEIRSLVNDEKIPIARNVTALENKAKKLRTELQHQLRLRDNREASLIQLENEVKQAEADLDYSLNLINKYVVSWFDGNPPAEKIFYIQDYPNYQLKIQPNYLEKNLSRVISKHYYSR